jgi:hypothetical protein
LVTAASSPQQQPLARWLGGHVPDFSRRNKDATKGLIEEDTDLPIIPPGPRVILGIVGIAVLGVALALSFSTALNLLLNPVWPDNLPGLEDLLLSSLR